LKYTDLVIQTKYFNCSG